MRVLVACEFSGIVREAFRARGHNAWSCDLLPTERPGQHLQCDVLTVLNREWDLMIAHPPCTYLASSGLHWNLRNPGRSQKTEAALEFVRALLNAPVPQIALENPVGCIGTRIRPADQIIQPWMFGDATTKATCLWLKYLPRLVSDEAPLYRESSSVAPIYHTNPDGSVYRDAKGKRYSVEHFKSWKKDGRAKLRSVTFAGIAQAMADQWGSLAAVANAGGAA